MEYLTGDYFTWHETLSVSEVGVLAPFEVRHFGVFEVASQALLSPQPQTPVDVLHLLATPVVKTDGRHEFATH